MDNFLILIFSGFFFLIAGVIIVLRLHYRKVIKEKERGIVQQIHRHDRLAKELEYVNVEKKVLEKMVRSKFDVLVFSPPKLPRRGGCLPTHTPPHTPPHPLSPSNPSAGRTTPPPLGEAGRGLPNPSEGGTVFPPLGEWKGGFFGGGWEGAKKTTDTLLYLIIFNTFVSNINISF